MEWKNPDGSLTGGVVIEDGAGNKLGTAANPLNVTGGSGGGGGSNASVGLTGSSVPAAATAIGFQNALGNLAAPTASAGLPVADSGAAITGASMPAGGVGLTGWLSAIWSKLAGTLAVSASSLPLPSGAATSTLQSSIITALGSPAQAGGAVSVSNFPSTQTVSAVSLPLPTGAAQDGTDATAAVQPTGGAGIRGWLSGIYTKLTGTLSVSWSGQSVSVSSLPSFPAGSNAIGTVGVTSIPDAFAGCGLTASGASTAYSGTGGNTFPLAGLATAGYSRLTLTCTAIGGMGNINIQGSNDGGTTWTSLNITRTDVASTAARTNLAAVLGGIYEVAISHTLVRVYASAWSTPGPTFSWCFKAGSTNRVVADQGMSGAAAWLVQAKSSNAGGIPTSTVIIGAATTNAGVITGAHQVYAIDLSNNAATWAYFRLYNKASSPTVGTDTVLAQYGVAPGASRTISFGDLGYPFAAGIAYSITAGAPLNDTTALAAASTVVATIHSN
jgi:hypothetical protein